MAVEPRLPRWLEWFDTPDNGLLGMQIGRLPTMVVIGRR